jgi:hypothetical protein
MALARLIPAPDRGRKAGVRVRQKQKAAWKIPSLSQSIPIVVAIMLTSCGAHKHPAVEDLTHREDLSFLRLGSIQGTRDGDRLDVKAMYTDSSSILDLNLRFEIGMPTRLTSGTWRWTRHNTASSGTVAQHDISFLGGQSGAPSVGGAFDLLADGVARYRVNIPLTELKKKLTVAPAWRH